MLESGIFYEIELTVIYRNNHQNYLMEHQESEILEPLLEAHNIKRRSLLPLWIKIFIWIFIVMGAIVPLGILGALFGYNFHVSLYGMDAYSPIQPIGMLLSGLTLFKGSCNQLGKIKST
jgi:hypothetical protein